MLHSNSLTCTKTSLKQRPLFAEIAVEIPGEFFLILNM